MSNFAKKKTVLEIFQAFKEIEIADGNGSETIEDFLPEFCKKIENELQRLESIDNADPNEALKSFDYVVRNIEAVDDVVYMNCLEHIHTIKNALIKLQEQEKKFDDNLVFKNGEIMSGFVYKEKQIIAMPLNEYDKLMKQKKFFDIVKEKNVNIQYLKRCKDVKQYNRSALLDEELSNEEFNLLKGVL